MSKAATDKQLHQLEFLQGVTQLVVVGHNTETVLRTVLESLLNTLGYDAAQIYQVSPFGSDIWLFLESGHGSKPVTQMPDIFSIDEVNIISDVVRQNQFIYLENTRRGAYTYFDPAGGHSLPGAEVALPLKFGRECLGVLRVQRQKTASFSNEDIGFLESLANLLASTMRNNRKIDQLEDSIQEIKTLYKLQHQEKLEQQQRGPEYTKTIGYEFSKSTIIKTGALPTTSIPDTGITTRHINGNKEMVAPIKLHGQTIGMLGLEDFAEDGPEWTDDDIRLLEEVSSQVSLAIENARLLQQTQEQTNELSILFEATRQLTETIQLENIYDILTLQIINYFSANRCSVMLLNPARTHFETILVKVRTEKSEPVTILEPCALAVENYPSLQQMLKRPERIIQHLNDLDLEPLTRDYMSRNPDQLVRTIIKFPLIVRSRLIGFMEVEHHQHRHEYTPGELQLAHAIISQVTVAIENAQLFEQTETALKDTQTLYNISRKLVESTSIEDVFNIILDNVRAYEIDRVSISLIERDQAGEIASTIIAANWDRDQHGHVPVGTRFPTSDFSLVKAFAKPPLHPLIAHDLRKAEGQDERMDEAFRLYAVNQLGAYTLFSAPMFMGPEYKGVLSIYTRKPHTYSPQEVRIYQTLADQAIIAIESYRLLHTTRQERDRASLLYELGQAMSRTTSVGEVQNVILNFIDSLGATDGELYITDGDEFVSLASTIPARHSLPKAAVREIGVSYTHEAQAMSQQEIVAMSKTGDDWPLAQMPGLAHVQSVVCVPFSSQRSTLQGVLSLYHTHPDGFSGDQIATFESAAIQTATSLENTWLLRQTNIVLHETELLYNITRGFNGAQSITDLLRVLTQNLVDPGIDEMAISFIPGFDNNGLPQRLSLAARWQKETGEITTMPQELHSLSFSFLQQLEADKPVEILFNRLDAATQANLDEHLPGARTMLAVPLSVSANWLGELLLISQAEDYGFKINTISQTATLASQAAVVIKNLQLVEETQQNLYHSEVLSSLGQQLLVAENAPIIYDFTLTAIAATDPDRGAAIFMYDQLEVGIDLEMVALWNHPRRDWPSIPVGSRLSTEELGLVPLLKTGLTVISANGPVDERFSPLLRQLLMMMQITTMVAVPLWLNKQVGGFMLIGNQTATPFPPDTIRLYEEICREASGALENRRLFDEVQYRAWQLQTAADISQAATAYLDADTLLFETVEMIKERFNFYHVSIFLVDNYQRYAIIRASTGEIGQKMLAMNHKLEVGGKSIVGAATATGKSRIALDVGKDAVHFNNPLLPETRSEMALPLIAQGRVIGALDVQSAKRSAFTQSDITILQSMANQLANAIEAAHAYQESRQALLEVQKLHQHYLMEQWETFLKSREAVAGFQLTEAGQVIEVTPALPGGVDQLPVEPERLNAPLTLHGQSVIGALDFEMPAPTDDAWKQELRTIVETVSSQAAQAIEAARLFEQTQISQREAEALYEVGRILVATESETEMFNTVLDKLLSTMGLKQGGVLFFDEGRETGRLYALYRDGQPVKDPKVEIPITGNLSYEKLIETKRPVAIEDFATDPLVAKVRQIGISTTITSLLLVPIIINDEVVGALGADAVGPNQHHFTEREQNLAMAMADQLAITLQNRRLIRETQRRAALLQTSSDVGRVATSILDEDVMMNQTVELIREGFGFEHAEIYLVDATGRIASPHTSELFGLTEKIMVGEHNVMGQALAQRRAVVARATDEATAHLLTRPSAALPAYQSQLAVPLQVGNSLIGGLNVLNSSAFGFTDEEISTLETLAAQLAVAIQNARTFREQQETAERLKEIDKLKTQFLANMSHELRTPLNSIIGFSRVILKGIDGPLTELQKADLTSIYNSGQHLLGLINNILDLSKIEAGKMELNFEETEVDPIIKTVMSTAIALVKDKSVTLHQQVPEHLPKIWADPTRIRQVILNLVSNACKFTDNGSVTTRVYADGDHVVFTVTDTGIGIPEEKLEHIFEEFTQVDASTTRKVGGTGLGLPISRHFVEMHHGEIWVQSHLGHGSTFGFNIPTTPPRKKEDKADFNPISQPPVSGQQKVVVAIDDDPAVIDLYRRFLEQRNYRVVGLTHGKDAVAQVKNINPHAILLDIIIPEKDGWSVMKDLKDDPHTKNIPVIICSIVSDKKRGFSLGASNYLTKPIVENDLVEALKHLDVQSKDTLQVLVVDDQADDVLLIRRMLEAQSNYTIIEASNGIEGLEMVKTKNPDLLILDLNMPEMDGFAMIEALKQDERTRHIPIIIASAQELTPDEHKRLTGQVEVLLRKGLFSEKELLEDVGRALEHINQEERALG